jgi:hypothetical protein
MDWDKNGMVNFKEFLFAFTSWVGIDDIEDEEEEEKRRSELINIFEPLQTLLIIMMTGIEASQAFKVPSCLPFQ